MPDLNRHVPSANILVEMLIDGDYFPIFCAKTADHTLDQDEIETTNINSGVNREYVPGMSNSTITIGGITEVNNDGGNACVLYLMQQSVRRSIHSLRVTLTDNVSPTPNLAVLYFSAFIRNTTWNKSNGTLSNCSVTYRITGAITHSVVIDPPVEPECEIQDTIYTTLAEAATSVSDPLLEAAGVEVLIVSRSGTTLAQVSGTPGNGQFQFVAGTGTINFDASNPGNAGGEDIAIIYKIEP